MRKMMTVLAAVAASMLAAGCCSCRNCPCDAAPKVSVFSGMINRVATHRGVSMAEAADLLRQAGVDGFDCAFNDPKLGEYAATSMRPANLYGFINFLSDDEGRASSDAFVAAAVKYGVPRIMCVPCDFTDGKESEEEYAKIRDGIARLVASAKAKGIAVTVEDYGGDKNPCSWSKYLKRFMQDIPDLRYALDSGNFVYAGRGEDILDMLRFAEGRIEHVHLKDFRIGSNRIRETIGLGSVPNAKIVRTMASRNYAGWYTLEDIVGEDRYEDVIRQVAMVRHWCRTKDQTGGR